MGQSAGDQRERAIWVDMMLTGEYEIDLSHQFLHVEVDAIFETFAGVPGKLNKKDVHIGFNSCLIVLLFPVVLLKGIRQYCVGLLKAVGCKLIKVVAACLSEELDKFVVV